MKNLKKHQRKVLNATYTTSLPFYVDANFLNCPKHSGLCYCSCYMLKNQCVALQ